MPVTVLFESDWRGHTAEWLQHILGELEVLRQRGRLTIVISPELLRLIGEQARRLDPSIAEIVCLSTRENWACDFPLLSVRAFCRWWVLRRYVRATGARNVIALGFDLLALPLALQLGLDRSKIVGILFRPSVHYPRNVDSYDGWRDRLRDLRKDALYEFAFRNPTVRTVFSLDPYFADVARHRYRCGAKVKTLADPLVCDGNFATVDGTRSQEWSFPADRTKFVLFGALTRRKGILVLLEALARIEKEFAERIAVFVAGVIEPKIRDQVAGAMEDLRQRRPEAWVAVEDRYVSQEALWSLLARSDVVLAPYQRFVGSSGILLWAARANKPVLTSTYGLLGRFVQAYRLGLAADTTDPSELAAAMIAMVRSGPGAFGDPSGRAEFLRGRSPVRFARAILAEALGEGVVRDQSAKFANHVASTTD